MKFQKTLLAASLAVAAVSANAAVVPANPVQVTENLVSDKAIYQDPTTKFEGLVQAPVYGAIATYDQSLGYVDAYANDYLPEVSVIVNDVNNIVGVDLGSQELTNTTNPGTSVQYDVFKYTSGTTEIFRFQNPVTGAYTGYYTVEADGTLKEYKGTVDVDTLEKGGKIAGTTASTDVVGFENKVLNGEHVLYGYQGATLENAGGVNGTIIAPDGTIQTVTGLFPANSGVVNDVRYVQTGILANTGGVNASGELDPSKNIYGVSARDNNKVTMLTGNGIALADLANKGVLMTDGSIVSQVAVNPTQSAVQKTRQYDLANGKTVVEVYNDDKDVEPSFYELTASGDLIAYTGAAPTAGSHIKTGTAQDTSGEFIISKVHNTVTSQQVRYSESNYKEQQTNIQAGITTAGANTTDIDAVYSDRAEIEGTRTEQYVASGVIGKNADGSNKYGTEVVKTDATGTQKTEITAGGINTTGVINAADYQIGGVSIVEGIKSSVDTAVAGATEAIDAKVAEVDTKIVEVDARLTQFNTTAANLNSRVDQLNSRVNEVEETAYRGVAIALAAQQQIPNIGAGQFAVFGGVGHYEGESAGALGVASVFADGRTSLSAAIGVAGGSEVGGRVGLSYVFGGK
ncbi:YadA C-terminal domain-containing protein [Acinetobacter sp. YH12086]|uniref:YadA C-terminal domain-containing protein n=1 Tax=Acinetobacter sp. YH12086 TaxID=2601078 RepID=UPI00211F1D12|nr:YadA C-terminal domain-containing protein [Acinetobacter sp. YH12086]